MWYCVSPKDAGKFDEMTRALFPDLYRRCPAFMRHKDILISPKVLRHHGINFMQVRYRTVLPSMLPISHASPCSALAICTNELVAASLPRLHFVPLALCGCAVMGSP